MNHFSVAKAQYYILTKLIN